VHPGALAQSAVIAPRPGVEERPARVYGGGSLDSRVGSRAANTRLLVGSPPQNSWSRGQALPFLPSQAHVVFTKLIRQDLDRERRLVEVHVLQGIVENFVG